MVSFEVLDTASRHVVASKPDGPTGLLCLIPPGTWTIRAVLQSGEPTEALVQVASGSYRVRVSGTPPALDVARCDE